PETFRGDSPMKTEESAPRESSLDLPEWFAPWAGRLADLYFSGSSSVFLLHGNTFDYVRSGGEAPEYIDLSSFLASQVFGRWDLVLYYDLASGLRPIAGRDEKRLHEMIARVNERIGDLSNFPKDADRVFALLDKLVQRNLVEKEGERMEVAVLIGHASHLFPRGEPGRLSPQASTNLVRVLNWASSPYVKRLNMAFCIIDPVLADLSDRLSGNPHVAAIELGLPEVEERRAFLEAQANDEELAKFSDFGTSELAELTAGISLSDLDSLIESARSGSRRLDGELFKSLKKRLIEKQCQGLLEFVQPKWGLDTVVGHDAAKARLREDAELLARGKTGSVPMGYLLCGPVGTGKSFLATCASGAMGVPCVMLKNFRSKYVGETEANLERILAVLRAMGPVVVIVDEADAALGDRGQSGDSGTSGRVFAMIAAQMGDTSYRGKILWMLLTSRPDLLPIDIKRQGRAEVHIPLFYPTQEEDLRDLFLVLARKLGSKLAPEDVPPMQHAGDLSGADVEGIVGRALRISQIAGFDHVTKEALQEALDQFMPSTQTLERELQEIAAIIECTDRQFLPPHIHKRIDQAGGRARLQERLTAIKRLVESM
ncbi:MAG: AAA family ATPase, partial [Planctomycetota bacterium]